MTLLRSKSSMAILLSLVLSVGNCVASEESSQQNNKLLNMDNDLILSVNKYFNYKIEEHTSNLKVTENTNKDEFKYLSYSKLVSPKKLSFDRRTYIERVEQMKKMQALASHISDNNNIELEKAEKIIATTFLEAEKAKIEPMIMLSVIGVESRYNQYAKSGMGAVGLVQVMPNYHKGKIKELKSESNLDMWSIEGNIKLGVNILKEYIALADGNVQKALQMYNGSSKDRSLSYSRKVYSQLANLDKAVKLANL